MHSQRPHVDYKYSPHKGPMDVSTRCSVDVKKKKKKKKMLPGVTNSPFTGQNWTVKYFI